MITPEMIEAAHQAIFDTTKRMTPNPRLQSLEEWQNWVTQVLKEAVPAALTAALALHKPGVPGEIEGLIERLEDDRFIGQQAMRLEAADALRSLVLEVGRLETECDKTRDSVGAVRAEYLQRWMDSKTATLA